MVTKKKTLATSACDLMGKKPVGFGWRFVKVANQRDRLFGVDRWLAEV